MRPIPGLKYNAAACPTAPQSLSPPLNLSFTQGHALSGSVRPFGPEWQPPPPHVFSGTNVQNLSQFPPSTSLSPLPGPSPPWSPIPSFFSLPRSPLAVGLQQTTRGAQRKAVPSKPSSELLPLKNPPPTPPGSSENQSAFTAPILTRPGLSPLGPMVPKNARVFNGRILLSSSPPPGGVFQTSRIEPEASFKSSSPDAPPKIPRPPPAWNARAAPTPLFSAKGGASPSRRPPLSPEVSPTPHPLPRPPPPESAEPAPPLPQTLTSRSTERPRPPPTRRSFVPYGQLSAFPKGPTR